MDGKFKRYTNLDILKIIGSILIVFHHYQQLANVNFSGINFYGGNFYLGHLVELFFMISGFLMPATSGSEKTIAKKYIGKCIRIYPSAILACSFLIIIVYFAFFLTGEWIDVVADYSDGVTVVSSYLLIFCGWFISGRYGINNPTWYLCILLLCYIIYYFIDALDKKHNIGKSILYWTCVLVSLLGILLEIKIPFFTYQNQRGYTSFFLGVLLYDFFVNKSSKNQRVLTLIILSILSVIGVWYKGINSWGILCLLVYPLLICSLIYVNQLPVKNKFVGGISYEIYLWHFPCFIFLKFLGKVLGMRIHHSYITMIGFLVFVEIIAGVIYLFYEIPVTKWLGKKMRILKTEKQY